MDFEEELNFLISQGEESSPVKPRAKPKRKSKPKPKRKSKSKRKSKLQSDSDSDSESDADSGYEARAPFDSRQATLDHAETLDGYEQKYLESMIGPLESMLAIDLTSDPRLVDLDVNEAVDTCRDLNAEYEDFYAALDAFGEITKTYRHRLLMDKRYHAVRFLDDHVAELRDEAKLEALLAAVTKAQRVIGDWLMSADEQLDCVMGSHRLHADEVTKQPGAMRRVCNKLPACEAEYANDLTKLRERIKERTAQNERANSAREFLLLVQKMHKLR